MRVATWRGLAAALLVSLTLAVMGIGASSAGAVAPKIDVVGSSGGYLAARIAPDGSVFAKRFGCSSVSCTGSAWTSLGGFVTDVKLIKNSTGVYFIVGRGSDGYIWYRSATCPNAEQCSYGPWIYTGGFGYDIQLVRSSSSSACAELAVIGGDRGVWVTNICAQGAGGWLTLGGVVTDIDYTGDAAYGIDPWNQLWRQTRVSGAFRGNWNNLGGYVRSPVETEGSGPFRVAAVGGDSAVWMYSEGVGWQKPANGSNVGDLRGMNGSHYYLMVIQTSFAPSVCRRDGSTSLSCNPLGGLITSLAGVDPNSGGFHVGIGTDGLPYYQIATRGWIAL